MQNGDLAGDTQTENGLLKPDADSPAMANGMYWPFFTDRFATAYDGRVFAPLAEVVTTSLLRLTYNVAHGLFPSKDTGKDARYAAWTHSSQLKLL